MQHEIVLEGIAFRLRPVALPDAQFIADLRSSADDRLKYVHRVGPDLAAQETWLNEYFDRPRDYYWIVERTADGRPEGTISLYNLDDSEQTAEWGRWVLRNGSLAALESSLLVYSAAFNLLNLQSTYCWTVAANAAVVSFHDSSGAKRETLLNDHMVLDGQRFDAVRHRVTRDTFPAVKSRLERLSAMVASKLKA
jgi:RimJ/RimL family protein N-acetyltransferase